MMQSKISYIPLAEEDPLEKLVSAARMHLRSKQVKVIYPDALMRRHGVSEWKSRVDEICTLNATLLSEVANRTGVYAIWGEPTHHTNREWELKYIGQTKADLSRQRIRSHLFWRNKDTKSGRYTGSMFDNVRADVQRGKSIGLSFVEVEPASLRHFVESSLITRFQPHWNIHGTTLAGQRNRRLRGM